MFVIFQSRSFPRGCAFWSDLIVTWTLTLLRYLDGPLSLFNLTLELLMNNQNDLVKKSTPFLQFTVLKSWWYLWAHKRSGDMSIWKAGMGKCFCATASTMKKKHVWSNLWHQCSYREGPITLIFSLHSGKTNNPCPKIPNWDFGDKKGKEIQHGSKKQAQHVISKISTLVFKMYLQASFWGNA